MAVELFLVLFFEAKYNLHGTCSWRNLSSVCNNNLGGIPWTSVRNILIVYKTDLLEYVCSDIFTGNRIFCDTFLVTPHLYLIDTILDNVDCTLMWHAYKGKNLQGALIDLAATVGDNTDDDLFPAIRSPHLWFVPTAQMRNILDDTVRTTHS